MRDRPFISARESPRPYSEIKAERGDLDAQDGALRMIGELEADAREIESPTERARLLGEAEQIRCAIAENKGRKL